MFQKLNKLYSNTYVVSLKYLGVLNILSDLKLAKRELEVLAYAASIGPISDKEQVVEYLKEADEKAKETSVPTVSNIISKLSRKGYLIRNKNIYKINPVFKLDFKSIQLIINIGEDEREAE